MAELINESMRKVIKNTIFSAQAVIFVGQMPRPMDFVKRIVGDLVFFSAQVNKLVTDVNKLLDDYGEIPTNYILVQVDSMANSANSLVNRANSYVTETINSGASLSREGINTMQNSLDDAVDNVKITTEYVSKLGKEVSDSKPEDLSKVDVVAGVKTATTSIYEWTGNGFNNAQSSIDNINKQTKKFSDKLQSNVNKVTGNITGAITSKQEKIHELINNLKKTIDKLSDDIDSGFSGVTGVNKLANVTSKMGSELNGDPFSNSIATASQNISQALNSFSIAKVIKAAGGVMVTSALVKSGLNELPPIDFESMLDNITGDMKKDKDTLLKELDYEAGDLVDTIDDLKDYDDESYNKFKKQYEEELKVQRDNIRLALKDRKNNEPLNPLERQQIKSAIKEVRKLKKLAKRGRKSKKFKDIICDELNNFKKEFNFRFDDITTAWNQMISQYNKSIDNINKFFTKDGDGEKYVNNLCDDINDQATKIVELCTNIGTQLTASSLKVAQPADIGWCFPNPGYKIASFWMDVKTIITFIKDLIMCVFKILKDIYEIAKMILTALSSLEDIVKDLKEFLSFDWLLSIIGKITNLFSEKINNAKACLVNTLTPIYYRETEEYSNTLEVLNQMVGSGYLNIRPYYKSLLDDTRIKTFKVSPKISDEEDFQEILDEIKEAGDEIIAYKSPILKNDNEVEVKDVNDISMDIEFAGWHFYHPNLDHTNYFQGFFGKIMRQIKSEIIKDAAETGTRKNGGVNMLHQRWVINNKARAYDAFYWYTIYTNDLEKDCFDHKVKQDTIIIEPITTNENGSIVQLEDGRRVFVKDSMVKSGDYVTVEGVKYRVK